MVCQSAITSHSNVSIVKTLLLQMPNVSFTQYRNELAQVLGTHQHVLARQFQANLV